MHMAKIYESILTRLEREAADINNEKELTRELVHDLANIAKAMYYYNCLLDMEYQYGEGQSNGQFSMRIPNMSMNDMSNGYPYMRSNGTWGRDGDGDGRYNESSRDNFRNSSYRGSSNTGYNRSNANQKLVNKLATLMDETMSEREQIAIDECIDKIKKS